MRSVFSLVKIKYIKIYTFFNSNIFVAPVHILGKHGAFPDKSVKKGQNKSDLGPKNSKSVRFVKKKHNIFCCKK